MKKVIIQDLIEDLEELEFVQIHIKLLGCNSIIKNLSVEVNV